MTDYPTVGLKVDLSGLDQGEQAYAKLQKTIEGVGDAAEKTSARVQGAASKNKAANAEAGASESARARAAAQAAAAEARATAAAAKEQERQRVYLQQVRINSIKMEDAARRAAQMEEARAVAQATRDAERAAKEQQRIADQAAKAQTKAALQAQREQEKAAASVAAAQIKAQNEATRAALQAAREQAAADRQAEAEAERSRRYLLSVRLNSIKMEEAAAKATAAEEARVAAKAQTDAARAAAQLAREQEQQRLYLQRVRLNSIKMEEAAAKSAAAEEARAAKQAAADEARAAKQAADQQEAYLRSAARYRATLAAAAGGSGGGRTVIPLGGGGGSGGPIDPGQVTLADRFFGIITKLRTSLTDVRRLFLDVRTAVGIFLAGMIVRPILEMADAMTALKARAGAFTDAVTDVPYLMEAIYKAAQDSRTPLESIATLYTRLAPLAKQLGKSQLELLHISETVAKGFQIGGATPEEAKSSAQQLAQALASNRLGGDELRSLAENAPILMLKIAQSLNMNTGQFIKWAQSGKANSQVVIKALEDAAGEIDKLFAKFPVTIGQSITLVKNAMAELVSRVNDATGASANLAAFISQFATFLDSASTVKAISQAVNLLGQAFHFLGEAFHVVVAAWPAVAAILVTMAASRLIAIAKGWTALRDAMLAFEVASVIVGRATATMIAAQAGLAAAAAATEAALAPLIAALGGPLGIALIAAASAYAYLRDAQKAGDEALEKGKTARADNIAAIDAAAAKAQQLGLNTDALTKAVAGYTDASKLASDATATATKKHDDAMDAAVARAQAEQQLTAAILTRRAAELDEDASKAQRSAGVRRFTNVVGAAITGGRTARPGQDPAEDARTAELEKQAQASREQAGQMRLLAANILSQKVVVTKPDAHGPPAPTPPPKEKGDGLEGARDRIAKLQAQLDGLRGQYQKMTADDPFATWATQIKEAGDQAAAALETGKKQNASLAEQTRILARQGEAYKLLNELQKTSIQNTKKANDDAADANSQAQAQLRSQEIMHDYMGQAVLDQEGYLKALKASRDAVTDQQVAEAKLAVARRYGVESLDDIAKKVTEAQSAAGYSAEEAAKNGRIAEDQAKKEAAAEEHKIRVIRAGNDALGERADKLQAIEIQYSRADETLKRMEDRTQALASSLASAFGHVGDAIGNLLQSMDAYIAKANDAQKLADIAKVDPTAENTKKAAQAQEDLRATQLKTYGDMISAAKGFFNENSKGYKLLSDAEKAYRLFEFAMSAKAVVVKTVETAAKVGLFGTQAAAAASAGAAEMFASLGPLGFAAVAAMVAVLAGFGIKGLGGGGGAPVSHMEDRQKAQGAGSVLGDATAKSDSIAKSLQIVAANSNTDLEFSNDMLSTLRSIDNNIGTLTASLARQLNVGGFLSTSNLNLGSSSHGPSDLAKLLVGGPVGLLLSKLPIIGGLINTLFGTTKTTTLQDAGIRFNPGTLQQIVSGGITGNTYQDLATQTKKKFFGITYSNKTSYSTVTGDLDSGIRDEITRVIASLRDGVLAAAGALGVDGAKAALESMVVNLGTVSFKDMTGDQIEAALQAIFSKLGDDMATLALPMITSLQKAGEGAFETLSRVARDYVVLDTALASVGQTFGAVGVSSLAAREHLIDLAGGIDTLTGQIQQYNQDFLTDSERMKPIITAVYTELGKLGYGSIRTKDDFKKLVNSLDLTTDAGAAAYATLLKIAPAFAKIVDYTDSLSAANDNVSKAQGALNDAYDTAAGLIGDVHDKFAAFVDTFKKFRAQLETGPLAANSPQDQYLKTKAIFEDTKAKAAAGNQDALNSLQSVSEDYLQASKDYYASTEPYFKDLAEVKAAVDAAQSYAQHQVDIADQQLQALNAMVSGLITVNNSVLTVAAAMDAVSAAIGGLSSANASQAAALQAAIDAANAAANAGASQANTPTPTPTPTAPTPRAFDPNNYLSMYPDVAAEYASESTRDDQSKAYLQQLGITSAADFALWHYNTFGKNEGRTFAKGGAFLDGSIVDQPTWFNQDEMGEAGPEAIVPLTRTADGSLGVRMSGGGDKSANDNKDVIEALQGMTKELKISNVLAKAGHSGTIDKLKELSGDINDVRAAIRANA